MPYLITQKPTFSTDLFKLDGTSRNHLEAMYETLATYAETPMGNTIKKLSGFKRLWRYRIGDYRIIYAVHGNIVKLLAAGARRDIYERFSYSPEEPNEQLALQIEAQLFPDSDAAKELQSNQEWEQYAVDQIKLEEERLRREKEAQERIPIAITSERLTDWQIPSQYHEAFINCVTETDLQDAQAPGEVVLKVMDIVLSKDASIIAEEPLYIVPSGQALVDFVEGRISQFLLKLDDKQEELVDWALNGPTLVKGGPGSGKSTVAMYRARAIVQQAIKEGRSTPSILFTTYTRALCNVSEELLGQLLHDFDSELEVATPDSIAVALAKAHMRNVTIESDDYWSTALKEARSNYKPNIGSALENSMFLRAIENLEDEYISEEIILIIEGRGVPSYEEYKAENRIGRGTGLTERQRRAVWDLYELSRDWIREQRRITWSSIRKIALDEALSGQGPRYDYLIIDEAQDLTPVMLRLCLALVHDKSNVFMAADMSQTIYNHSFSYSKVHEDLDVSRRTRLLKRNYRTTEEIVRGALEVMENTDAGDAETLLQQCVKNGPKPTLYMHNVSDAQLDFIVQFIRDNSRQMKLPTGATAILCPTNNMAKNMALECQKRGLSASYMPSSDVQLEVPEVKVMTMHASKGLEFPMVVIPFMTRRHMPGQIHFDTEEKQLEYERGQRRLLFVGATRAMRRLLITSELDGDQSPYIQNFTTRAWNKIIGD